MLAYYFYVDKKEEVILTVMYLCVFKDFFAPKCIVTLMVVILSILKAVARKVVVVL